MYIFSFRLSTDGIDTTDNEPFIYSKVYMYIDSYVCIIYECNVAVGEKRPPGSSL